MNKVVLMLALVVAGPATADQFIYKCKAHGKPLIAKIDGNVLKWRGKAYKLKEQPECAKYGWTAQGYGRTFDVCTATQGYLDFEDEDGKTAVCDLKQ